MKLHSLKDLLVSELDDLLSAEKQLLQVFPKIIKSATHVELSDALKAHQRETAVQESRLERCIQMLGIPLRPVRSHGMVGLVSAWMELQGAEGHPHVLDAATISAVQRIEHYEIAGYGCAHAFAETLEQHEVAALLKQTLLEEEEFDRALTKIAKTLVNRDAELQTGR